MKWAQTSCMVVITGSGKSEVMNLSLSGTRPPAWRGGTVSHSWTAGALCLNIISLSQAGGSLSVQMEHVEGREMVLRWQGKHSPFWVSACVFKLPIGFLDSHLNLWVFHLPHFGRSWPCFRCHVSKSLIPSLFTLMYILFHSAPPLLYWWPVLWLLDS